MLKHLDPLAAQTNLSTNLPQKGSPLGPNKLP
jgi:hypothetical protein